MINFSNQKQKKEKTKKEIFAEIKRKVTKLYPDAQTKMDIFNRYYVVTKEGYKIIPDEGNIKNNDSVFGAWKNTLEYLSVNKILHVNDKRFSPHKITDSIINKMLNQT